MPHECRLGNICHFRLSGESGKIYGLEQNVSGLYKIYGIETYNGSPASVRVSLHSRVGNGPRSEAKRMRKCIGLSSRNHWGEY